MAAGRGVWASLQCGLWDSVARRGHRLSCRSAGGLAARRSGFGKFFQGARHTGLVCRRKSPRGGPFTADRAFAEAYRTPPVDSASGAAGGAANVCVGAAARSA